MEFLHVTVLYKYSQIQIIHISTKRGYDNYRDKYSLILIYNKESCLENQKNTITLPHEKENKIHFTIGDNYSTYWPKEEVEWEVEGRRGKWGKMEEEEYFGECLVVVNERS